MHYLNQPKTCHTHALFLLLDTLKQVIYGGRMAQAHQRKPPFSNPFSPISPMLSYLIQSSQNAQVGVIWPPLYIGGCFCFLAVSLPESGDTNNGMMIV